MSKLHISLQKMLDVPMEQLDAPRAGVVANIYAVGATAKMAPQRRRELRNLVIPFDFGNQGRQLEVEVEPGAYLVEVTLPSGHTIDTEVAVGHDEVRPVILEAPESPHEWLSWQHLQGKLPRSTRSYQRRKEQFGVVRSAKATAAGTSVATGVGIGIAPDEAKVEVLAVLVGEAPADSWRGMVPTPEKLDASLSKETQGRLPPSEIVRKNRAHAAADLGDSDEVSRHFLLRSDTPAVAGALSAMHNVIPGSWQEHVRLFCSTQHGDHSYVSALPVPWRTESGAEAPIDLATTFVAPPALADTPQELQVIVAVRDARIATLLGYVGSGNFKAAASVFGIAKNYLQGKVNNPFAAAAGAYVLLQTLEDVGTRREEWTGWIRNLMSMFENIPDGAVLQGWLNLKTGGSDKILDDARKHFLEAFRRGIPYYSVGVRMLVDGLTLFSNDAREAKRADPEVDSALEIARWFALKTDIRQPFTTVRLPQS